MATTKSKAAVERSLLEQKMGADADHYVDLVGDYLRWWGIHQKLQRDITRRGTLIERTLSTGITRAEVNPSVKSAKEAHQHMLAILRELGVSLGHGAEVDPGIPEL